MNKQLTLCQSLHAEALWVIGGSLVACWTALVKLMWTNVL